MRRFALLTLIAVAVTAATPVHDAGAAVRPLSLNDLVDGADLCVRGTVVEATPSWTADQAMIYTTVVISPIETLMGSHTGTIEVRVPGGDLDGLSIRNGEAPSYGVGEDVVVFLQPDPGAPSQFRTYGWFQGKLTLLGGMVREMQNVSWQGLRSDILWMVENK